MKTFSTDLQSRLELALREVTTANGNPVERALFSLKHVEKALWELKEFTIGYDFETRDEEIHFFKEVKTHFTKEQVFFDRLLFIESNRPVNNKERQMAYLQQMLLGIDLYFRSNQGFYMYYRMNRNDMDAQLFVRQPLPVLSLIPASRPDLDARFGNPYSLKLAKIQAYEQMAGYLTELVEYLETGQGPQTTDLFWSGTDSQFMELMIALHSKGAINNGNLNLTQMTDKFGRRLGYEPRNIHQVVKNIRGRKKERTVFLQQLIESAERKLDETDQDI